MENTLDRELEFFKQNQESLVEEHHDQVLVIKDQELVGVYDNKLEAYQSASENFEPGSFLIQEAVSGEEAYTQTFHSRISH
jgi:hypothetical protein